MKTSEILALEANGTLEALNTTVKSAMQKQINEIARLEAENDNLKKQIEELTKGE